CTDAAWLGGVVSENPCDTGACGGNPRAAGSSVDLSMGREARQQAGDLLLSRCEVLPALSQRGTQLGKFGPQRPGRLAGRVSGVSAAAGPDLDQAVCGQQPDGGLSGVQGNVVLVAELPVRREPGSGWVGAAGDLRAESIGEQLARVPFPVLSGH